jgi:hypothetical protein
MRLLGLTAQIMHRVRFDIQFVYGGGTGMALNIGWPQAAAPFGFARSELYRGP